MLQVIIHGIGVFLGIGSPRFSFFFGLFLSFISFGGNLYLSSTIAQFPGFGTNSMVMDLFGTIA